MKKSDLIIFSMIFFILLSVRPADAGNPPKLVGLAIPEAGTDKGWNEANRLNPVAQEISREALSCMDKEQLESLVDTMRKVRENLLPLIARSSGK